MIALLPTDGGFIPIPDHYGVKCKLGSGVLAHEYRYSADGIRA